MRRYLWNFLVSIDQLLNTILGGDPDETVSSRAAKARDSGKKWGKVVCSVLDRIDPEHCEESKE